jgi:hypothetical protein
VLIRVSFIYGKTLGLSFLYPTHCVAPLNFTRSQSFATAAAVVSGAEFGSCFVQEQKKTRVCTNDFVLWVSDLGPAVYLRGRCLIRTG